MVSDAVFLHQDILSMGVARVHSVRERCIVCIGGSLIRCDHREIAVSIWCKVTGLQEEGMCAINIAVYVLAKFGDLIGYFTYISTVAPASAA
jgi:cytochrome c-type biogenesis protein CcmH/NrfF